MRPSPNSSGQGLRLSTQLTTESVELTAVALQLRALGVHDVRGRVLDETLVREHPFGARDFLLQPIDLGGGVSVGLLPSGLHDRFEDTRLFSFEGGSDAAPAEDRRRVLDRLQGVTVTGE